MAGFTSATVGGPRTVAVLKLDSNGEVDGTFGSAGVVTTELSFAGGADEIDVITQADGKLLISATTVDDSNPGDRDIAVLRLTASGEIDTTFATNGVREIDLSSTDMVRSIAVDTQGRIYLFAAATAPAPRTDSDFVVLRLNADGSDDASWNTQWVDVLGSHATPRSITLLADGSVVAVGYANSSLLNSVQPVVFKLSSTGALVSSFGTNGIFHEVVLTAATEPYAVLAQGSKLLLAGYGRVSGDTNDFVAFRIDASTGARDLDWSAGARVIDVSGTKATNTLRGAIALPGDKTLLFGATGAGNQASQDGALVMLDANGALDTKYGTGVHVLPFGMNGADQFWSAAVSGNNVLVVGTKGAGTSPTQDFNDDAWALLFPLR